jgi:crossover junction endodeoxyribonuclease RusA
MMVFPWPDSRLSPNKRIDRRQLIAVKGEAKKQAYAITREMLTIVIDGVSFVTKARDMDLQLTLTFYPPDRRKRDLDNLYATFKAYQDGMFLALGIDDCKIERVILQRGNPIPGGQVFVQIVEA